MNQFAAVPTQSGGSRHFDMAREMRSHGLDVRIVASDLSLYTRAYELRRGWWDALPRRTHVDGVPFHWLPAGTYRGNDWRRAVSMLVFAAASFLYLVTRRHRRGDVIVGSSPQLLAALAAWVVARIHRLRFVFEVRDLWPESFTAVSGQGGGVQFRIMRWMSDFLYRRSDHIVVLAAGSRGVIEARGAPSERITWIPNGVDLAAFPAPTPSPVRPPVRFIYAGAHGPANGLDLVVQAAAWLAAQGREDIEVLLVGDGPAKEGLSALADQLGAPIRFEPPVPKADVPALLASCDIGLMVLADVELFRFGVSPNKLFDYLAAGLPVLTNVPGFVSDVVQDAGAGVTVAPGDPRALAEGMITMAETCLRDPGAWRSGRAYVERHFDRSILAAEMRRVIEGVRG